MNIAVYCSSSERLDDKYYELGYMTGLAIGRKGHNLVYGGYDYGIMGRLAEGVRAGGGKVIAVVPEIFHKPEHSYEECDVLHLTENLSERKKTMEELASCFIVLPGGIGTMDELFSVAGQKAIGALDKPIKILNAFGIYNPLGELLNNMKEENFLYSDFNTLVTVYDSVEELAGSL